MVKDGGVFRLCCAVWLLGVAVLSAAAWSRGAEYDEQYTLFLTAGVARPTWPAGAFPASLVRSMQEGGAGLGHIALDLRRTDVHPPLYFWTAALWRGVVGPGLFGTRLLSVAFSLGSLALVGILARQVGVPPALAMLLTLGCYGFVYTGVVARGFAMAQMLNLAGVACALAARRRRAFALATGALFGAASAANYLAVFVAPGVAAAMALGWVRTCRHRVPVGATPGGRGRRRGQDDTSTVPPQERGVWLLFAALAFLPFLALDFWFFLAQRDSRSGQFPPFHLGSSLVRLAQYAGANLFGGLPLYVPHAVGGAVSVALAVVAAGLAATVVRRWGWIARPDSRLVLAAAGLATPAGLLVLGAVFNNTPIELRYLALATPFVALVLAGALGPLPRLVPGLVLAVQALAIAGLMLRPETMQPARDTAAAAAALVQDGVILVPYGNDGVGIVGAFAVESHPETALIAVHPDDGVSAIRRLIAGYRRVLVAQLAQDDSSRSTIPAMLAALQSACWHHVAERFNIVAYKRICAQE